MTVQANVLSNVHLLPSMLWEERFGKGYLSLMAEEAGKEFDQGLRQTSSR
jgi:hypothetical protein